MRREGRLVQAWKEERDANSQMRAQTPMSLSVPLVYLGRSPSCFARTRTTVREDETNGWMDRQMDGWVDGRTCHTDLSWLTDCFRGGFVGVVGGRREACEPVCVSGVQRKRVGARCGGWSSSQNGTISRESSDHLFYMQGRRTTVAPRSTSLGASPNNGDRDNYCNYRRNSRRERESGKDTPGAKPHHFDANLSWSLLARTNAPSGVSRVTVPCIRTCTNFHVTINKYGHKTNYDFFTRMGSSFCNGF